MTQLLSLNLPIHLQCLKVPIQWVRERCQLEVLDEQLRPHKYESWCYQGKVLYSKPQIGSPWAKLDTYDPWEMRTEFLRLESLDGSKRSDAFFAFLQKVGAFATFEERTDLRIFEAEGGLEVVGEQPLRGEDHFWEELEAIKDGMRKNNSWDHDFKVRFVTQGRRKTFLVLTTVSFVDAVRASQSIDRVLGAKIRKCARADCGTLFSTTSNYKQKYCQWYCGHLESVRRSRKPKPVQQGIEKRSR
jgi:hypothetical protein